MTEETASPADDEPRKEFAEMAVSAQEAASAPVNSSLGTEIPPSIADRYATELHSNMQAHRIMRWVAFGGIGFISLIFVLCLLVVMSRILHWEAESVPRILRDAKDWHAWAFVGACLVIFAAIPLSLMMALIRMISVDQEDPGAAEIRTPATELGKVLIELFKAITAKLSPP
ncbi:MULTISPECIES: hypothetical protein [unclassified Luteimonas]|uniref:hypothetical protein n=1 Tax=unclassified Luteimonas TaxID=2629088 RepID=UPI0011A88DA4|nr:MULTISPECIES: hypothetical protein [unclassified Luteimonas]